jgi:hypothetical protein
LSRAEALVAVEHPWLAQPLLGALLEAFVLVGLEVAHFDRQRAPHPVQHSQRDSPAVLGRRLREQFVTALPDVLGGTQVGQGGVVDRQQPDLLEVG